MLHEIQPGDVVIVTGPHSEAAYRAIVDRFPSMNVTFHCCSHATATETSVHVIRAKKAEDKPKPDIVCTRCGTPATISNFCMCGKPGCIGCIGCCKKSQSGEPDAKPKPDWPAWRDVRVEKPPDGKLLLVWNSAFGGRIELGFLPKNPQSRYTHWMPLPEGPK